jgi:hypothetical protein
VVFVILVFFVPERQPVAVAVALGAHRVTKLSPRPATADDLAKLFEDSLRAW